MGSRELRQDEDASAAADSALEADSDGLAGFGDTHSPSGDAGLHGGQEDSTVRDFGESVGELEQKIPRLEDAAKRVWGAGNLGAKNNVLYGTRRPLVKLASLLADGHYFLVHKRLRTPRLDYIRRSLIASLRVSYGLARELERQIDITRKDSHRFDRADDVVRPRARSYRAVRPPPSSLPFPEQVRQAQARQAARHPPQPPTP